VLDTAAVLAAYDTQIRQSLEPPVGGWLVKRVGPVVRAMPPPASGHGGFIGYTDLDESRADAVIAEQVEFFRADGRRAEWKVYGHDRPADLPERLLSAGLEPEDREALVVGEIEGVLAALAERRTLSGVVVREADIEADLAGIVALHEAVWGNDEGWMGHELAEEKAHDPAGLHIFVAADEPSGEIVSAAWLRVVRGTDFAGLWGGSTLEAYRGRGVYKALVDVRATLARDLGYRYVQVDASPDSEPILRRLGLELLTWTQPYVWKP